MEQIDLYKLSTPCFILDEAELKRSIDGFTQTLQKRFSQSIVGYSVKTNSLPYALHVANEMGTYAEVVSFDEYHLALKCGFSKDHIIYNGPMKSKETFLDAICHHARVNIETKRELEWLKELPLDQHFEVGIRLNVNISKVSMPDADGENDNSRFGFSDETEDFVQAIIFIRDLPNVMLAGLHIHRTTHTRSVDFYRHSIHYAAQIISKYQLNLSYLDVGGGYFGIFANKPTYEEYSQAFYEALKVEGLEHLMVIVEPGNALVASAFSFLSEVIDVKHVEPHCYFITTDGSRNDIDPFFKKSDYIKEFLFHDHEERPIVAQQIISGCTCLEYDRMFCCTDQPKFSVKDRILYHNVGAYTMCLTPLFIRYIPNVYVKSENGFQLVREQWTASEYIQKSKF